MNKIRFSFEGECASPLYNQKKHRMSKHHWKVYPLPQMIIYQQKQINNSYSASHDNWCTVGGNGGCMVGEVRAGTTSPMPDHKGFKLQ